MWYTSVEEWSFEEGRTWNEFEERFFRRFKPTNFNELIENSLRLATQEDPRRRCCLCRPLPSGARSSRGWSTLDALRFCWVRGLKRPEWNERIMTEATSTLEAAGNAALHGRGCGHDGGDSLRDRNSDIGAVSPDGLQPWTESRDALSDDDAKLRGGAGERWLGLRHQRMTNLSMRKRTKPPRVREQRRCYRCGQPGHIVNQVHNMKEMLQMQIS